MTYLVQVESIDQAQDDSEVASNGTNPRVLHAFTGTPQAGDLDCLIYSGTNQQT